MTGVQAAFVSFMFTALARPQTGPAGWDLPAFNKPSALDWEEQQLVRDLRWIRPPLPPELLERYPRADPRWVSVIDKALAERHLAVIGGQFIPLDRPVPVRKHPSEGDFARIEARTRVLEMVECWKRPSADPPAGTSVDLRMLVAADGKVKESFLMRFEPRNAEVEGCVLGVAKKWFFWPSFRTMRVRVRLAF
jgi:hypothetical protein